MKLLFKICLILILFGLIKCVNNGLGKNPQMGWNSWNHFRCNINQNVIKQTADRIVQLGLDKKGYVYINVDDCWQVSRNSQTNIIQQDKEKFSSGMSALGQYIHSKGLKFGIYSDAGQKTCQGRPGSYGYQKIDAQTYAKWEVDYLKYDNCYPPQNVPGKIRYQTMGKALNQTGRLIFYSICNWGKQNVWQWAPSIGNSWRTTYDISNNWKSVVQHLQDQNGFEKYASVGGWNDPDMLEVGNGNLTDDQSLAHFSLWCLLKAPLIIGCDLNTISKQSLQILSNEQLIGINQDSLGIQGKRIKSQIENDINKQVWGGKLSNNRYVVIFFNRGDNQIPISVSLKHDLKLRYGSYRQRDPVRHVDIQDSQQDIITENVKSHSVQVRILQLKKSNIGCKMASLFF